MDSTGIHLQSFNPFRRLPAEIRREIYILASEPRLVELEEHNEENFGEFWTRLSRLDVSKGLNLDPALDHFAHNWSKSFMDPDNVALLDMYMDPRDIIRTTELQPMIDMDAEPTVANINPHWLKQQPYLAWWLMHKSRLASTAPIPAFLHVNRESRHTLISYGYTLAFGNSTHAPMTWFHFERDILHLSLATECLTNTMLPVFNILCHSEHNFGALHPSDLLQVRRLSLSTSLPQAGALRRMANVLGLCGYGVKELFIPGWWLDHELKQHTSYEMFCQEKKYKKVIARGKSEHNATRRSARVQKRRAAAGKSKPAVRERAAEVARLVAKALETKPNPALRREPSFITPCQDMDYVYSHTVRRNLRWNKECDFKLVPWGFSWRPLLYWPDLFEHGTLPDAICLEAFQRWRRAHAAFFDGLPVAASTCSGNSQDEDSEMGGTSSPLAPSNYIWGAHDNFIRTMLAAYLGVKMPNAEQEEEALKNSIANETIAEASEHSQLLQEDAIRTQTTDYQITHGTEPFQISHPNWKHDVSERILPVVQSVHIGTPWAIEHLKDCRTVCYDVMETVVPGCEGKTGAERMHEFVMTAKDHRSRGHPRRWHLDLRK